MGYFKTFDLPEYIDDFISSIPLIPLPSLNH